VLSPDFLLNYVAFAPRRGRLSKDLQARLPVSLGLEVSEYVPEELVGIAEAVRAEMVDLPEHLIRRKIRDAIDEAKMRKGMLADGGLPAIEEQISRDIENAKKNKFV
jgi:hypothetical protein